MALVLGGEEYNKENLRLNDHGNKVLDFWKLWVDLIVENLLLIVLQRVISLSCWLID